mgnify:CR=1 FL=1
MEKANTLKKTRNLTATTSAVSHSHSNKTILDNINQLLLDYSHTHSNFTVLNATTASFTTALLTEIQALRTELDALKSHTHSYLDNDGTIDTSRTTGDVD